MIDLSPAHTSQAICPVDASALAAWVESRAGQAAPWIVQPDRERKPQRLVDWKQGSLLTDTAIPLVCGVLAALGADLDALEIHLSCMLPGQAHGMHQDQQHHTGREWLTRVHVPVLTNKQAWFTIEGFCTFPMPAGHAYTFNALRRHDFGNGGPTPRVHLIFDVVKT